MTLRRIGGALIAVGLLATPALAQTSETNSSNTPSSTTGSAPGSVHPPMAMTGTNTNATGSHTSGSGSSLMGERLEMTHGGYLSSKLVGATVYNDQKQDIGSIDNLIVGANGQISTAVISVGGFLGVGSKLVDVPFSRLQFRQDGKTTASEVILPNATEASLKSMQAFTYKS
jgi:hypothetical protein